MFSYEGTVYSISYLYNTLEKIHLLEMHPNSFEDYRYMYSVSVGYVDFEQSLFCSKIRRENERDWECDIEWLVEKLWVGARSFAYMCDPRTLMLFCVHSLRVTKDHPKAGEDV